MAKRWMQAKILKLRRAKFSAPYVLEMDKPIVLSDKNKFYPDKTVNLAKISAKPAKFISVTGLKQLNLAKNGLFYEAALQSYDEFRVPPAKIMRNGVWIS